MIRDAWPRSGEFDLIDQKSHLDKLKRVDAYLYKGQQGILGTKRFFHLYAFPSSQQQSEQCWHDMKCKIYNDNSISRQQQKCDYITCRDLQDTNKNDKTCLELISVVKPVEFK